METDDGERRRCWREFNVNVAVRNDHRCSAMSMHVHEYDYENFDEKSSTGAVKDRSISSSCGQLLKRLKWRDYRHDESEAPFDDKSKARVGDDNSLRRNEMATMPRVGGSTAGTQQWKHDCQEVTVWEWRDTS